MSIKTIFKLEENLKKFNAVIPAANTDKRNWKGPEDEFKTLSNVFTSFARKREYTVPDFLYYFDRNVLLVVFWLDTVPTQQQVEDKDYVVNWVKEHRPFNYFTSGKKLNLKSQYNNYGQPMFYDVRGIFLLPYELEEECQHLEKEIQNEIVCYRYIEHDSEDSKIHYTLLNTGNPEISVEVEFFNDIFRYFELKRTPQYLLFGKIPMQRVSLRDACFHRLAPFEAGVYAIIYKNQIMKIGMSEATLFQRLEYYYYPEKNKGYGYAENFVNDENLDEIEVAWITCPSYASANLERDLQFIAWWLGLRLPWQRRNEFNTKEWIDDFKRTFILNADENKKELFK